MANNAQMLKRNLSDLAEKTGATKFNLIAHSKGGIDARYFISTLKGHQMVASLSTISTPHLGTPIADYLMEKHLSRDSVTKKLIQRLSFLFGGQSPAPIELIRDLSVKEMRVFNQLNPNMDNVFYQGISHAGITDVIRKNIGDVDIPQIYLDIIRGLGALGL